ncbi:MAG: hypothetical protein AAF490_25035 [Chloroflexota bacterium]
MSIKLDNKQWAVVALVVITALMHIVLGVPFITDIFGIIFILNGIGYLALVAGLYFLPQFADRRGLIRWILLGYTAVTIILYFAFNPPSTYEPVGLINKAVEIGIVVLLWLEK